MGTKQDYEAEAGQKSLGEFVWETVGMDTNAAKKGCHAGRYTCVNLENRATIELRIFRGTLKYNIFLATLHMISILEFLFSSELSFPGNWTEEYCLGRELEEITTLRSQIRELLAQEHPGLWEAYREKAQALQNRDCQAEFERGFLTAAKLALELFRRISEEGE